MGLGIWFNPVNFSYIKVEYHEVSAKIKEEMDKLGLSSSAFKHISKYDYLNPKHKDKIRMLVIDNGMVRLRDNKGVLSVQFKIEKEKVRDVLASLAYVIRKEYSNCYQINIDNFEYYDSIQLTYGEFFKKLKNENPILMNESIRKIKDLSFKDFAKQEKVK